MKQNTFLKWLSGFLMITLPGLSQAAGDAIQLQNFTQHRAGWLAIGIFVVAYILVIGEEALHLRKSIPTMVAAGFI